MLRSFQTGGITYSDFLGTVNRYLAAGESPAELLEVIRRRQLIEPLPDFAHDALARLLNAPSSAGAEEAPGESSRPPMPPAEAVAAPGPVAGDKTVATPRARSRTNEQPRASRTTPADPAPRPRPAASSKPAPAAQPEKTIAMPRAARRVSEGEPMPSIGVDLALAEYRFGDTGSAPDERPSRKLRTVWFGVALLAVGVGWLLSRPSAQRAVVYPATGVIQTIPDPDASVAAAPDAHVGDASAPTPTPAAATAPAAGAAVSSVSPVPAVPAPGTTEGPGSTLRDCPTCPQMTVLPAGRFRQGSAFDDREALPAEKPQHIVLIRRPFAISTTELTVANFREFAAASRRDLQGCETYDGEWHHRPEASWKNPGFTQGATHPVTCVSWNDALAYADWLSAKTGHRYRLPSASEWEYAERAGSEAALPWDPRLQAACEHANVADRTAARRYPKWSVFACRDGFVNTAPVGSFKANTFGLRDMLGNVFEWTQDCWHEDYAKAPIDGSARMDGDCSRHELRGGSWFSSPAFVRPAYRNYFGADHRSSSIGVRLVREMTP